MPTLRLSLAILALAIVACVEPEPEPACNPKVFEAAVGIDDRGINCGDLDEPAAIRDCLIAAQDAGEFAYALRSSGFTIDSSDVVTLYVRPGEQPPAWSVHSTNDPYAPASAPTDTVEARPCPGGIEATDSCTEGLCVSCVDRGEIEWSCER